MRFVLIAALLALSRAFLVPGIGATKYKKNDEIPVYFNKAFSERTQLPFAYSQLSFTCAPSEVDNEALNFGELFQGDRIVRSDVKIKALVQSTCEVLCRIKLNDDMIEDATELVNGDYRVEWLLDGLPGATKVVSSSDKSESYEPGFAIGDLDKNGKPFLNNFFHIRVGYKNYDQDHILILGFEVFPRNANLEGDGDGCKELKGKPPSQFLDSNQRDLTYAYSVEWFEEKRYDWSNRWDKYIESSNPRVHWYSIINSLMLLTVLTFIVAFILLAALRKDISAYNEEDSIEGQDDSIGWKLVHGDVFRAPKNIALLSTLLGTGIQLMSALGFTLAFAVFGILNPSYRGGLVQYFVFFFAFCGLFGGYHTVRMYKSFATVKSWMTLALGTASAFPLMLFLVTCITNTFYWAWQSSNALPFGTFVALISIWLFINVPMSVIGTYFGNKKQAIEHPTRTNQIPRQIPVGAWYLKLFWSVAIGGVVPFTVIFMELYFIIKSMWQDQYYYMFGFLAFVLVLLVITCVEVTITMIYFQLCSEDYRWHWKSFMVASSSAWYIFLLGVILFITRSDSNVGLSSGLFYFAYLFVGLVVYFCVTGTIGFISTYWFLRRIYSAVKVD